MKIIFWGTPEYSVETLKNLINSEHDVLAVVTQPDKKRSRGNKLTFSPTKQLAVLNNIPVLCPDKIKNNDIFINSLKSFDSDIFIVIAYGKILSKEILLIPKYGCWNAHASLLPRWRGAAPIHWSLLKGDKNTGVGIMKMEEGLDTGDILIEEKINIKDEDNLDSLSNKLSSLSSKLIIDALEVINKKNLGENLKLLPQNEKDIKTTYARMITKSDYILNLNDSAENILRRINGLYPNAFIRYKNKKVKITKIKVIDKNDIQNIPQNIEKNPGFILSTIKNLGIVVSTETNPIIICEIKMEGKNFATNNQLIQQMNPKIGDKIN